MHGDIRAHMKSARTGARKRKRKKEKKLKKKHGSVRPTFDRAIDNWIKLASRGLTQHSRGIVDEEIHLNPSASETLNHCVSYTEDNQTEMIGNQSSGYRDWNSMDMNVQNTEFKTETDTETLNAPSTKRSRKQ